MMRGNNYMFSPESTLWWVRSFLLMPFVAGRHHPAPIITPVVFICCTLSLVRYLKTRSDTDEVEPRSV
jgi:hypothetical protein